MTQPLSAAAANPSFLNGVKESAQAVRSCLGNLLSRIGQCARSALAGIGYAFGRLKEGGAAVLSTIRQFFGNHPREMRAAAIGVLALAALAAVYKCCKPQAPAPKGGVATPFKQATLPRKS